MNDAPRRRTFRRKNACIWKNKKRLLADDSYQKQAGFSSRNADGQFFSIKS